MAETSDIVTVDADRLERHADDRTVAFIGQVTARQGGMTQYADRIEVYLDERGERILHTVSTGNVRIHTVDCRIGVAEQADYDEFSRRMVLSGNARVWQDSHVTTGEQITLYVPLDRPPTIPASCPQPFRR